MRKYTDAEIDYVIDALDFGFIRNRIKSNPEHIQAMMNTYNGIRALTRFHLMRLWQEIKSTFQRRNK